MVTLQDIKDYQLKILSKHVKPNQRQNSGFDYPYDDDGYVSDSTLKNILNFWQNFHTDSDFQYLVSCEWEGDLDLNGGRSYLLSDRKLLDMLFDYMYNKLKWSSDYYDTIIYNSNSITDELQDRYNDASFIRDIKINAVLG